VAAGGQWVALRSAHPLSLTAQVTVTMVCGMLMDFVKGDPIGTRHALTHQQHARPDNPLPMRLAICHLP
jgi:hypothetical protein